MTTDQTGTVAQDPIHDQLSTLIERWVEVADAYKPGDVPVPWDAHTQTYADYRHIYLRNIRDLKHVIDSGRMPCSLMTNEERRRGDCGRNHEDEYDKRGQPESADTTTGGPWTKADLATERDPWAPAPDITTSIPEPIRRVLAGHLAEMLLDQSEDEVRKWARGITFELKREGLDLGDAIKKRITDLTLGTDPSDPPF